MFHLHLLSCLSYIFDFCCMLPVLWRSLKHHYLDKRYDYDSSYKSWKTEDHFAPGCVVLETCHTVYICLYSTIVKLYISISTPTSLSLQDLGFICGSWHFSAWIVCEMGTLTYNLKQKRFCCIAMKHFICLLLGAGKGKKGEFKEKRKETRIERKKNWTKKREL